IADSAQTAFNEGHGICFIKSENEKGKSKIQKFSNLFELDGITFEKPSLHLFTFNNPYGACKKCGGFGSVIGIDERLVIPDPTKSIYDGAIAAWRGEKMSAWNKKLIKSAFKFDFPIHKPYFQLKKTDQKLLWEGNEHFKGLNAFFKHVEAKSYKIQYRVMLSRYRGKTICPECEGTRLRSDANYVKIANKSITDIVLMPVEESAKFFKKLKLSEHDKTIAKRILVEINNRLEYLENVGLGYLTLNRLSNTLSGGESQRINLATSIGSSLVGSMYILDEPSIGLHPRDTARLIKVLKSLQQLGNTLIIVEHEEEIMKTADYLVDIGPEAGSLGGELVYTGDYKKMLKSGNTLTSKYLKGTYAIDVPEKRRKWKKSVQVIGAKENNLKNLNIKFPLGVLSVITGVSGSGKTSLVKKILTPALKKTIGGYNDQSGSYDRLAGNYSEIEDVEMVDQNPIGKSSRSNPVTYLKIYDDIRALYADLPQSKTNHFKPAHFSFNVDGGRCDVCQGEGKVTIEMQFMADIQLTCENCKGKKFKDEILDVEYRGNSIYDLLEMTVDDASNFFKTNPKSQFSKYETKIATKLKPLVDVGLGYVRLGQSASTFSGGEAQRIKLASFLSKGQYANNTMFIFDEPTTGLHFHDIKKLLFALNALVDKGNTVVVIEHNAEIIKCADWVIDLGPEGGDKGGNIVFEGVPEDLIKCKESYTGKFLKGKLK
ncbi:MAG: excinuclease ABC subunit UvrA, partial [Bacteroidia bacterium]|nr:excinuclease ABC subunit UvrA [Bacteroidia bacterium]